MDDRSQGNRLAWAVADIVTMAKRNILAVMRTPEALFFTTLQPIMFVLLFTYVFGGAIHVPGGHYIDFLMPGIFVQTVIFGAMSLVGRAGRGPAQGHHRALPRPADEPLGRAGRPHHVGPRAQRLRGDPDHDRRLRRGLPHRDQLRRCSSAASLVILFFAYALSWGFAYIGLSAPNAETAQVMVFPLIFPLLFASSAFVPVATMPGWLQVFAEHQPVTQVVDARALADGRRPAAGLGRRVVGPGVVASGLLVVLAPIAVRKYRKVA